MEASRTSQVPGEPSRSYAVFSDPGRTDAPDLWNVVGTAPAASTAKAPAIDLSRLYGTALKLAVYASCDRLPGRHATLASGCWPLCRVGFAYPQGPIERFRAISYIASPFPKLYLCKDAPLFVDQSRQPA